MGSNNELKETDVNVHILLFWLHNISGLVLDDILVDEKSYENFVIDDVAQKIPYSAKPLRIIFEKVDGYIRKYDRTKYLGLFHSDRIMLKSNILGVYAYKYMKVKINSDDNFFSEKTKNIHNVVILVKSVFNKNHYHYQAFYQNVYVSNIHMLYNNRIDASESVDVRKTSTSRECTICHCWYF